MHNTIKDSLYNAVVALFGKALQILHCWTVHVSVQRH